MTRYSAGTVVLWVFFTAAPSGGQGVGLRAGLSFEPEQFYFGAHAETGPVVDELRFRPNLEAGFGQNRTLVMLNGEFVYPFQLRNGTRMYAGGGPAVVIITRNQGPGMGPGSTSVEPGFNFLIGVFLADNVFGELKLGAIDSPGVKLGLGFNFP
jgi:hypothetical protein